MASIKKINGKGGISYKITVTKGREPNGKQIRHYKTWNPDPAMTPRQMDKEAQRVAYEFERNITIGFEADNRQTFAQYADYVYNLRVQRGDKIQTLARVKRMTARINEYIGSLKLLDIRPQHINNLYAQLAQPGANRWRVFAASTVDFKTVIGGKTRKEFARDCGVDEHIICRLYKGGVIQRENARIIAKHTGRKDLFVDTGTNKPLSPGTIRDYHGIIHSVLAQAEREMIIPYNPAARATLPKKKKVRETKAIQPEDLQKIIVALETEPIRFRALVHMLIVTGCRRGEVLALKWDKVDFINQRAKIDHSLCYTPGSGVYEGETKTGNTRFIDLPDETTALLREYRAWQLEQRLKCGDLWRDTGYVFTRWDGIAQNPGTINVMLSEFCKRHGLSHVNPHAFRHTAASIMIAGGVDIVTVAKTLGHSDITTTLDTYGHEIEDAKKRASECVADVILRGRHG